MATVRTVTVGPGRDYASLSAALTGESKDLVTLDRQLDIACYAMSDTTAAIISGFTTDATRYIRIYTPVSERHSGKWDDTKYYLRVSCNNTFVLTNQARYVRIEGLQIECVIGADSSFWVGGINSSPQSTPCEVIISSCIVKLSNPSSRILPDYASGFEITSTSVHKFHNCIAYDWNPNGIEFRGFQHDGGAGTDYWYNCTAQNCYIGFNNGVGSTCSIRAKNCGAAGCGTGFSANITQTTCSSSTPTFVNAAADDFHLASTDTIWKDKGTSLSGDSFLPFTTDIDGQTRSGTWDIGADEYQSGVTPLGGGNAAFLAGLEPVAGAESVFLAATEAVAGSRAAFLSVLEGLSGALSVYLAAESPAQTVASKAVYLAGLELLATVQAAQLAAAESANGSQAGFLAVLEPVTQARAAFLDALETTQGITPGYLNAIEGATGAQTALLDALEGVQSARAAYVDTLESLGAAEAAFLDVVESANAARAGFLGAKEPWSLSAPFYLGAMEPRNVGLLGFLIAPEPSAASRTAWLDAWEQMTRGQGLYLSGCDPALQNLKAFLQAEGFSPTDPWLVMMMHNRSKDV